MPNLLETLADRLAGGGVAEEVRLLQGPLEGRLGVGVGGAGAWGGRSREVPVEQVAVEQEELPLRLRDGSVDRLTSEGRAGHLGLPRIADELYRSAQRLRVFVAKPIRKKLAHVVELVAQPAADVRKQVG